MIKFADSDMGLCADLDGKLEPCERPVAALAPATDAYRWHYSIAATRMPRRRSGSRDGKIIDIFDPIVFFAAELKTKQSAGFPEALKSFYANFRKPLVLIYCDDETWALRLRKLAGGFAAQIIAAPETKKANETTLLNDWLGRRTRDGKPVVAFDEACSEFLSGSYLPARICVAGLLRYFDAKTRTDGVAYRPVPPKRGY